MDMETIIGLGALALGAYTLLKETKAVQAQKAEGEKSAIQKAKESQEKEKTELEKKQIIGQYVAKVSQPITGQQTLADLQKAAGGVQYGKLPEPEAMTAQEAATSISKGETAFSAFLPTVKKDEYGRVVTEPEKVIIPDFVKEFGLEPAKVSVYKPAAIAPEPEPIKPEVRYVSTREGIVPETPFLALAKEAIYGPQSVYPEASIQ